MKAWRRVGLDSKQLADYCQRIRAPPAVIRKAQQKEAHSTLLRQILTLHLRSIPFENLNLMYEPGKRQSGGQKKTDLESLMQTIVVKERGGYCFESNELLAQVLTGIGYNLYTAAGRVVLRDVHPTFQGEIMMTRIEHEIVLLHMDENWWVCDVGQGSTTPLEPVLLSQELLEREQTDGKGGDHRVRWGLLSSKEDPKQQNPRQSHREGWYMQKFSRKRNQWNDIYFFTEQEWRTEDYEPANLYCQSDHHVLFTKHLVVALHTSDGRKTIEDTKLRIYEGDQVHEESLDSEKAIEQALERHFGVKSA